ncbi:flagellar hook-length control protein FliK [Mycoplana dimorpha]|uniref:Chemotaxis protein MotD n=1 Tax=Mycoplana dimorpha TaxID=28320 RepID=A0A2T5BFE6_MYCDI|nr:flagellar hook-length control protein FliK [Mycoplana dimorpha]PTM97709.1 chemotaxis protein MotD [Mycoplana dimorpha]
MTTIYTGASSQIPTHHPGGRDRMQGEGDGKGAGRFEDAFEATRGGNGSARRAGSNGEREEAGQPSVEEHPAGQDRAMSAEGHGSTAGIDASKTHRHRFSGFGRQGDHGTQPDSDPIRGSQLGRSAKAQSKSPGDRVSGEAAGGDRVDDAATEAVSVSDYDGLLSLLTANDGATPDATAAASVGVASHATRSSQMRETGPDDSSSGAAGSPGRGEHHTAIAGSAEEAVMEEPVESGSTDRIFRLARSDGRGKPVDIAISGNGETTAPREPGGTPARVETVAVLDSRRYLGLAQTGNSTAVTAAIAQDPSWAAALMETADGPAAMTGKVVNTLKIQLHPIDLGTVTATLRLQGEALVVDLKVETGKAYRNLSDDQEAIVRALRGHGFTVDQVSVQLSSPSDRSGGAGQGDAQAQFSGQQQAREGNGRQGGGESRTSPNRGSDEGIVHDNGQAGGLDSTGQRRGTGGVYL